MTALNMTFVERPKPGEKGQRAWEMEMLARVTLTFLNGPESPDADELGSYTHNEEVGQSQCIEQHDSVLKSGDHCHSRIQRVAEKEVTLGRGWSAIEHEGSCFNLANVPIR